MNILPDLNDQQRQAVLAPDGPVLIVAGPGTGKTKTLTARIVHILSSGAAEPSQVLGLTFTIKAAHEMIERIMTSWQGSVPHISTFHALGLRLLQAAKPGQSFVFATETQRLIILRDLTRPQQLRGLSVRELALLISNFKDSVEQKAADPLAEVVHAYDAALHEQGLIDFDDLLSQTFALLRDDEALRGEWQARYQHILVDEFQDTSPLQWALLKLLAGTDNVFVIGDPKQSIYGFRGAGAEMFDIFRTDFPRHREIMLKMNYRSDRTIVALASAIFGGVDALEPFSKQEGSARAILTLNEYSEADFVLQTIEQGIGGSDLIKASVETKGRRFKDFAVLYRTHRAAKSVQQRLHDSGIPFQVVGDGSPYDQPEVRAVIDCLQWVVDSQIVPVVRGFRETQLLALLQTIDQALPVSQLAEQIIEKLALATTSAKQQRLQQFVATLVRFDAQLDGLRACLDYIERLSQDGFYDPNVDAVTLLTIHAAKGLEFQHVLLIAAEDGVLPHIRKTAETDFDEERRLFYVAVTRAKQELDILHTKKRGSENRQPSRFITELTEAVLPRATDPSLAQLEKRLRKRQQKARQATLF